jgi:hypothetical protein
MSVNKAVRKLNSDMKRLDGAKSTEAKAKSAVTKAQTTEKAQLASIATQKQAIVDAFVTPSATPLTAAQQTADLNKLFQLGQKQVETVDSFTATIAKDRSAVTKDGKAVASDRKTALKDLRPAEEHLNLKDTNIAREKLGLRPLSKPIRPPATGGTGAAGLAEKYLGKFESQLQADGVTLPCPTNESCANFVSSMLVKSGASNFRTLGVSELSSGLEARGWKRVPLADAKPGDVWICLNASGAPSEQHTELVASNKNGHVTLIGSNNFPVDANQQINYDSSSANIAGTYILSPP